MKKRNFIIAIMFCTTLLSSCGSTLFWYCNVDAIGEQPSNKTYFAESRFPDETNLLVAKEYMKDLDITMSHLGYTKVDSTNAALKITFGYNLGNIEEKAYTYSTPVWQYNPPTTTIEKTNTTIKTQTGKTIANVNSTTTSNNNTYGSISYAGERTKTKYVSKQEINLYLDAFDTQTKEPIWSVRINDKPNPSDLQNLRRYMPMYLLNMFPYIGENTGGMRYSKVDYKDVRLQWYNSQVEQSK
ncbi:MAG: hypothetical protein SPF40_04685 [Prevotella sp.]|nr:hypothetical protein [Prevotella sp.]